MTRQPGQYPPGPAASGGAGGFSLLELAAALIVVAIAGAILLGRLAYYEELAEKARMEATISMIKSALRTRMARLMIEGRVQEYAGMDAQNPFDWLERKPDDYRGVLAPSEIAHEADAGWYFDSADHTLVYRPRNGRYFRPDSTGLKRVRLKVTVTRHRPPDHFKAAPSDMTENISLEIVEPYRWFHES